MPCRILAISLYMTLASSCLTLTVLLYLIFDFTLRKGWGRNSQDLRGSKVMLIISEASKANWCCGDRERQTGCLNDMSYDIGTTRAL